jgi:methylphosphotriester-DNA--protein-cysteine methyltransferase
MDFEQRYQAMETRDESHVGEFFAAVTTTGIYCRPGCPARTPKRENVRFYRTAEAALIDGFRACLRCKPDLV